MQRLSADSALAHGGVFADIVHDLCTLLREIAGRKPQSTTAVFAVHTWQSSPESSEQTGYDGHKKKRGSKARLAMHTLHQLLAAFVAPANEQDRAQIEELAAKVEKVTGNSLEVAFMDQGYAGDEAAAAQRHGTRLEVSKLPTAKRGLLLSPRR